MPPRYSRRRYSSRARRRRTTWADTNITVAALTTGTTNNYDLLSTLKQGNYTMEGSTCLRIVGDIQFEFTANTTLSQYWYLGFMVGRAADVGTPAPAGAITPVGFPFQDWMLLRQVFCTSSAGTVDAAQMIHFDIRSRRRIKQRDDALLMSIYNSTGATQNANVFLRALVALP